MLAAYAHQSPTITKYAVARQKRTTQNALRFSQLFGAGFHESYNLACTGGMGDNHFITAWMEVKAGLRIRDPPRCPTADEIHIAGNRLALDFTESITNRAREEGVAATSLSWSSSIMRLIHNGTHDWLHKCLRHMPSEHHLKANISLAAPLLKDISEMLAPIRAHQKCTAAVSANNTSTQRHLRLALEAGCESCTRNSSQKGSALAPCAEISMDFSTCCL